MKKILLLGLSLIMIQSIHAQVTRAVSSFSELLTALAASASNDTISLAADITAISSVAISKSVQIKGNSFTIAVENPGVTALGTLESTTTIYALIKHNGFWFRSGNSGFSYGWWKLYRLWFGIKSCCGNQGKY